MGFGNLNFGNLNFDNDEDIEGDEERSGSDGEYKRGPPPPPPKLPQAPPPPEVCFVFLFLCRWSYLTYMIWSGSYLTYMIWYVLIVLWCV